jgi:hypothetical protein
MAEQAEPKPAESTEHGSVVTPPPGEEKIPAIKCVYCGDVMVRDQVSRFNRTAGIGLLVLGLVISALVSLVVGLPFVVIGAYLGSATRSVWVCRLCAAMVDRDGN